MKLEIEVHGQRLQVTLWIWRSWSGRRWRNGREYHGPVYYLGRDEVARPVEAK